MKGKMDVYGMSDIGKKRQNNEDQFLIADLCKSMLVRQTSLSHDDHTRLFGGANGSLLVVADGMGGHAAGKRASTIAVDAISDYLLNTLPWFLQLKENHEDDLLEELKTGLEQCQNRIEKEAAGGRNKGMGTTLTLAYILWPRMYVMHVGDTRCYLLRNGTLRRITKDHTMAQGMIEKGVMTAEEAQSSRWSHVLWNCLGGNTHEFKVEVHKAKLEIGDGLLLCSDGLTNHVDDKKILQVFQRTNSSMQTCSQLIEAALENGGSDNITTVVARFKPSDAVPDAEAEAEEEMVVADTTLSPPTLADLEPQLEEEGAAATAQPSTAVSSQALTMQRWSERPWRSF